MKKHIAFLLIFIGFVSLSASGEVSKKKITIDNLYSIELSYDSSKDEVELFLYSDNSNPIDSEYAESSIEEAIEDIKMENDYQYAYQQRTFTDTDYDGGKFTRIERLYLLEK